MADIDFNKVLSEFKSLSKDLGRWPLIPRLTLVGLVLVLVAGLLWFFLCKPKLDELDSKKQEEASLRNSWLDKKKQAVGIEEYRAQLSGVDLAFGALLKQLPGKTEMDALITDINQAGLGRGLRIDLFKPGAESVKEFYATLPISLKLTGAYHDLGQFVADVAKLPRIVTLSDISMETKSKTDLSMAAQINTYRYLDQSEVDAARKEQKKGPATK